jgi:hypothetical protein
LLVTVKGYFKLTTKRFLNGEFYVGSGLATSIPARAKQHNLMSRAIGGPRFRRGTEGC